MNKFMVPNLLNSPPFVCCARKTVFGQTLLLLPATLLSQIETVLKFKVVGICSLYYTFVKKTIYPFFSGCRGKVGLFQYKWEMFTHELGGILFSDFNCTRFFILDKRKLSFYKFNGGSGFRAEKSIAALQQ